MLSVDPVQRPELEEVWNITQSVVQSQSKATGGRMDVHSVSELLVSRLTLLEADVSHKLLKQNGKRVDLPPPPADALRELHPLSFAEPLRPGVSGNGDLEQKQQLGILVSVFAWLLRMLGRADVAQGLEALLEHVPSPRGRTRRMVQSAVQSLSPQPPPGKRSGTPSGKPQRGGARAKTESSEREGGGGHHSPDSNGSSPPSASSAAALTLSPCAVPSCLNILKGAEAVKKAAQAVGLSTEFAPVNAIAVGYGRAVCSLLQEMLNAAVEKVQPAARRPRYLILMAAVLLVLCVLVLRH